MAITSDGIVYPVAGDYIAPLNAHLQALAETTQEALNTKVPSESISYTPTFAGLTIGNGIVSAKYTKIGNIILDEIVIIFGSTTAVTGAVSVIGLQESLTNNNALISGNVALQDSSGLYYSGVPKMNTTSSLTIHAQLASGTYLSLANLSSTVPFTWTVADRIVINTIRLAA
jgi:hypothetical protein